MTDRPTVRERILDAAEACLRRDGIRRTSVAAVAEEAGVSRAYLYRFFPDKSTLLSAALIRRDEEFWSDARERIAAVIDDGVATMVTQAVLLSRRAPLGPLALELAEAEPEAFAEVVGTYVHEIVPGLSDFWVDMLRAARDRGRVRADLDLDTAAEWVIRVLVSLVGVPGRAVDADDHEALHAYLGTYLEPAFRP
ncbi:TetR/AcrR family transcriptional regulator [Nocardioides mangrovi]|uniref:TetR/AcrR family transcriptional regulator n=1 Tax=Nocardioides mangrovi TaxID=2874580 RepID=A0ABS7UF71_9ACTN|nr:TetR/AcrR family transcriptional regulator [Nocardioides mangrovi]MBZ5739412.1 TetR/AcrR family transcriptional regulator [Nocardioides mangrovi]